MQAVEVRAEELTEEVVVAVPATMVVERNHERVRPVELSEHIGRAGDPEHRVAQGGRHPAKHRRREQEFPVPLRLPGQDDLDQIVGNLPLPSRDSSTTASPDAGSSTVCNASAMPAGPTFRSLTE